MQRQRISEEVLNDEAQRILTFCLDRIVMERGRQASMMELFVAYKAWLRDRKLPRTEISVDGFGRMFPRIYTRRVLFIDGVTCRGISNAGLK